MVDQPIETSLSINGIQKRSRKGIKRQWKDLPVDPLADGFDEHKATYIIGRSPISWAELGTGALFSRSKSGKALHIKIDAGHAVCLDLSLIHI